MNVHIVIVCRQKWMLEMSRFSNGQVRFKEKTLKSPDCEQS